MHLAAFAPAFTFSLCESESSRKPQVRIASVVRRNIIKKKQDKNMGLFDKLFGKKQTVVNFQDFTESDTVELQKGDTFISTGDNYGYKIIRQLTEEQRKQIEKSTISLRTGQLY